MDEGPTYTIRIMVNDIGNHHRRFYRELRKMGWQRYEANLLVAGACTAQGYRVDFALPTA